MTSSERINDVQLLRCSQLQVLLERSLDSYTPSLKRLSSKYLALMREFGASDLAKPQGVSLILRQRLQKTAFHARLNKQARGCELC
jgi:hypothetical protein